MRVSRWPWFSLFISNMFSDSYSKGTYSRDSYYKPLIWDMVAGLFWIESKGEHKGCNEAIDDNKG